MFSRVSLLLLFISFNIFSQDEKRLALVIGNSNYDSIAKLANPVNDAKLIAKTLDSLNFDVILETDLDKNKFMSTVIEFGKKRKEYDVGFVYYAGHGVQINGENYLLPTNQNFDEEWKIEEYAVNVNRIMKYLTAVTNQVNILILDACRNNPWEGNFRSIGDSKDGGLAKMPAPTGSLIAFSTEAGSVAADGDGENSIYCKSLVKNMMLEDTSLDQVFRNVRKDVLNESNENQRPIESSQLTGDAFYLVKSTFEKEFNEVERLLEFPKGNYEELINIVSTILVKDESNKRAYRYLGEIYSNNEKYDSSLEALNTAISIDSLFGDAYSERGVLYDAMASSFLDQFLYDKMDEYLEMSLEDHKKSIEIDSLNTEYYNRLGNLYYFSFDDNENGLINYNKAIKIDSLSTKAIINRASFYSWNGDITKSTSEYNKLIKYINDGVIEMRNSDQAFIYRNRGNNYNRLDENEKAINDYRKAVELNSEFWQPLERLVYIYYNNGDTENQEFYLNKFISLQEKSIEGFLRIAEVYLNIYDYDSALKTYNQMEIIFEDKVELRRKKMELYYEADEYEELINLSEKTLDSDNIDFDLKTFSLWYNSVGYEGIKEFDKAENSLNKLIEIEKLAENYKLLALFFYRYSEYLSNNYEFELKDKFLEKSISQFNLALDLAKENEEESQVKYILKQRHDSYISLEQYSNAIRDLEELNELENNSNTRTLTSLADTYSYIGDYEKTFEYYKKALDVKEDAITYRNLGITYTEEGVENYDLAIENFNKSVEINLANNNNWGAANAYYWIGITHEDMDPDNYEKPIEYYKKALEFEPEDPTILNRLADSYSYSGNKFAALQSYLRIEEISEKPSGSLLNDIAILYKYDFNDTIKSIEIHSKNIEINPNYSNAYSQRGRDYLDLKKYDKAKKDFDKRVELDSAFYYSYSERSNYFMKTEDFVNAEADLTKAIELVLKEKDNYYGETIADLFIDRAAILIKQGKFLKAIDDWKSTYEYDIEYKPYAHMIIGDIYTQNIKDFENGIIYYNKALELEYWDPQWVHDGLALAYLNLKEYDKSVKEINKAIELSDDDYYNFLSRKINIMIADNNYSEAKKFIDELIEINRKDPDGFYKRSVLFLFEKKYLKSLNQITLAIEKFRMNTDYFINDISGLNKLDIIDLIKLRAEIYKAIDKQNLACEDYEYALRLNENPEKIEEIENLVVNLCQN